MNKRNFIVATAGHVDHGKSALVKALTGIDPDRLPEEKARGITIDLGFAHLELPAFHLGIVDVPGHEDFVKNMVAGVSSIDLALFVVAVDDGWMPQTEEHLQILAYLGVTRAVIALTKIDLVESDEAAVIANVREKLRGSPFAEAPIVPTSVISGHGLNELKITLANALQKISAPRDFGKPRLPVDRVFTLRGIGTVVTGTLTGGFFRRGQNVVIQPRGKATRIRSVQNHNREVEGSPPGTRTALNLPDINAAQATQTNDGVRRGDVITLPELGEPGDALDVLLEKSPRLAGTKNPAARPLKDGAIVRVHLGSANFSARIFPLNQKELTVGNQILAEVRADVPFFAFVGDRFIIRDWQEQTTLAGGIVLDADARREKFRTSAQKEFLETRAKSPDDVSALVLSQLERDHAMPKEKILVKSHFSPEEIQNATTQLMKDSKAIAVGGWLAEKMWWQLLCEKAAGCIDAGHGAHPERLGLPLSELRTVLESDFPSPEIFNLLVAGLCREKFSQVGIAIQRKTHRPALPPNLQVAGSRVRAALAAKPFEPPSRKELAPDSQTQQALRFLVQTGEAVELADDVVISAENFSRATEIITKFLRERGSATVSELRQVIGSSRRIVVPLLERLDRDGVTRREGDKRTLR